ncbi:hypothetical protein H2508_04610 [Parahaliea sp. F7430]|uniref:Uncharacterized protein n=1 Tax=Sediminihaliea albiluteola TaxID=2758564 RepID=A0A7W2TUW5_9GAMM|nr:hypothetical protein [Sediminihaliea albiluteola]MBA6412388.1 hypothetical protein [Sediminihaliea albiluteola]
MNDKTLPESTTNKELKKQLIDAYKQMDTKSQVQATRGLLTMLSIRVSLQEAQHEPAIKPHRRPIKGA